VSTAPNRYHYAQLAADFDRLMNRYDLERRLEILFDELITHDLRGCHLLDAGCGTGWFSLRAAQRGARVVSLDIAAPLAAAAKRRSGSLAVAGDALCLPFPDGVFELVISSEMIEHTEDPRAAVRELARVLTPGGVLALTCPNRSWQWVVRGASRLGLRPFDGIENFPSFTGLRDAAASAGLVPSRHFGFHPWPFQLRPLQPLSRLADRKCGGSRFGHWMINQALLASKPRLQSAL
jgi:SAM-dependent methyltransferase